eukprot:UN17472
MDFHHNINSQTETKIFFFEFCNIQ